MNALLRRSVIVTGGSRGLGEAICRRLAGDGYSVAVFDLESTSVTGERLAAEIGGTFLGGDVSDPRDAEAAVAEVVDRWGSLDALVNNAGVTGAHDPVGDFDVGEWHNCVDVNLNGTFYFLKYALAQMGSERQQPNGGGAVVNMSSLAGFRGMKNLSPYVASKFAIRGLTKAAAVEYAHKNIRVNCVAPTFVKVGKMDQLSDEMLEHLSSQNALPGVVQPRDVAGAVSFLLSDDARYITGHCLPIDAGALSRVANAREE